MKERNWRRAKNQVGVCWDVWVTHQKPNEYIYICMLKVVELPILNLLMESWSLTQYLPALYSSTWKPIKYKDTKENSKQRKEKTPILNI